MNGALITTSLPALKPFLQPMHNGSVLVTASARGYQHGSSPVGGSYLLSSRGVDKESRSNTITPGLNTIDIDRKDRPSEHDKGSVKAGKDIEDAGSVASNDSQQGIIRATTTWQVRYEDSGGRI